ncbi:AMP-binding protein, partial [Colwellia marinimaniae]
DVVNISAEDRLLAVTTIGFDIAVLELFLPLVHGATLVLANEQQSKDNQALSQLLSQHKISVMQATPTTWQSLADIDTAWWSSLNVLTGGE